MKYDASTLMDIGGYTPEELQKAKFTAKEVFDAGITDIKSLKDAGYSAGEIKGATDGSASDFKEAEFTLEDLKDIFDIKELLDANFALKDFHDAGINASVLRGNGFNIQQLKDAGYSLPELKGAFSAEEFGAGNISYADARAAGYEISELRPVEQYALQAQQEQAAIEAQQRSDDYWNYLSSVKTLQPKKVKTAHVDALLNLGSAAGRSHAQVLLDLVGGAGGSDPFSWKNIFKPIIDSGKINRYELVKTWPNGNGTLVDGLKTLDSPNTLKKIKEKTSYKSATNLWHKYKTGGLADYTGPAWLDGTPSKPELVLNATDTKNFIALKDVLSRAMSSTSDLNGGYGDVNYEININVEKLTSDYDVDKVADRVKKIIVKDSSYRNVTQVRKFR